MPSYVNLVSPGAVGGSRYGTWASQSGGSIGGDISTASGLPYNSGMMELDRPGGYWTNPDYLTYRDNALQQKVARRTGQAIADPTGRYSNPVNSGVQVPYSNDYINPNDPNQRYQPVDIVKAPDIASAQTSLLDTFKKSASDSLAGFNDYLKTFKDALSTAFNKSGQATDPTGTINSLQSEQQRYSEGLDQNAADYQALNQDAAARERAIVQESRGLLPQFDEAQNRAEALQRDILQGQVSRYKAGSGTPMSLGSAEERQLVEGARKIAVPIELAKINQRYNVLSDYALPVERDIAGRETQRIGVYTPAQLASQFQSGTATTQAIQQLRQTTSSMAMEDAIRYMQAIGVPAQVQQSILSGQIGQLSQLGSLEDATRYRGLQDRLGAFPTAPQTYSVSTPGYSAPPRYTPISSLLSGIYANNAPRDAATGLTVSARNIPSAPRGAQGAYVWDAGNARWQNWQTGEAMPAGFQPPGAQSASPWVEDVGQTWDPYALPADMNLTSPVYSVTG